MTREPMWRRYLRLRGPDAAADVTDEVAFHLEARTADLIAAGMPPDAARREALARFGDATRYVGESLAIDRSLARHRRLAEWLHSAWRDTRVALRQFRRSPWFAVGAISTLALGIGATLAMYRLVDAVVLRPLPGVSRPHELVEISSPTMAYPSTRDVREALRSSVQLAAFSVRAVSVVHGNEGSRLTAHVVSGNYFPVLGARAALGRLLVESDDDPAAPRAVVLSHATWRSKFQQDSAIVGRSISLNSSPAIVVGVAAPGFRGTRVNAIPGLWLTAHGWFTAAPTYFSRLDLQRRGWGWLTMIGRLRPGSTPEGLAASLKQLATQEREWFMLGPTDTLATTILSAGSAASGGGGLGSTARSFIWVLFATVALVLVLAWVNVASLLVARGLQREREIGVRLALGASRRRLLRQLLTETALLAVLAGAASFAAAYAGTRLLSALAVPGWGPLGDLSLGVGSGSAVLAVIAAVATSLLFGLLPALRATRRDVVGAITRGGFKGQHSYRLRDALLVSQIGLTVTLLVSAGLFMRGLQRALAIDPGFDATHTSYSMVDLGMARYDAARARGYFDAAGQRLAAIPGATAVAWADVLPLSDGENIESFDVVGNARLPDALRYVEFAAVSDGYFEALEIRPKLGRVFNDADRSTGARVVVVNESFARKHGDAAGIVGRQLLMFGDTLSVIGVVGDVKYHRLNEEPRPYVYGPLWRLVASAGLWPVIALVRTTADNPALPRVIESTLRDFAPDVAPFSGQRVEDHFAAALLPQRLSLFLLGACSLLAFVIALVGVYSLVSFFALSHRRELALRIALGAQPQSVVRRVLRHGLLRVAAGAVLGTLGVVAGMRAARTLLYGVAPTDPVAIAVGTGAVFLAAMLASFIPARLASRMDAMRVLRQD